MKDYAIDLAKQFKKRNNIKYEGPIIGRVVEGLPKLKIAIYTGEVILDLNRLYFANHILEHIKTVCHDGDITIDGTTNVFTSSGEITFEPGIKVNDQVLIMPDGDGQFFYVIDLVRKFG